MLQNLALGFVALAAMAMLQFVIVSIVAGRPTRSPRARRIRQHNLQAVGLFILSACILASMFLFPTTGGY